jgi:hypothetical protein
MKWIDLLRGVHVQVENSFQVPVMSELVLDGSRILIMNITKFRMWNLFGQFFHLKTMNKMRKRFLWTSVTVKQCIDEEILYQYPYDNDFCHRIYYAFSFYYFLS